MSSMRCRPPTSTPFPYTTLFRSWRLLGHGQNENYHQSQQAKECGGSKFLYVINHIAFRVTRLSSGRGTRRFRSEEHTSELQSHHDLVCRLLLEKKKLH